MASGKKKAKAEQKAIADQQLGVLRSAQQAQMEPTAGQKALDERTVGILSNKGDWSQNPYVNWASGQVSALKNERAQQNRGAYTFGSRYADPNLLLALGSQEEANAAQDESLGRERAIESAIEGAQANALSSAGLTSQRYGSVLGSAGNTWDSANRNYLQMVNQPGFWSQALLAGISGAGGMLTGGMGSLFGGRAKAIGGAGGGLAGLAR